MKVTLRDLRKQANKTCAEVAEALNVTVSAVSNYEKGIRSICLEQVKPLANLYGVTVEEIIDAAINSINYAE